MLICEGEQRKHVLIAHRCLVLDVKHLNLILYNHRSLRLCMNVRTYVRMYVCMYEFTEKARMEMIVTFMNYHQSRHKMYRFGEGLNDL